MAFLTLYAVGQRPPQWVSDGFADYARRLPPEWALELVELKSEPRHGDSPAERERARARECERLRARVPRESRIIALDERGVAWSSEELAAQLTLWRSDARPVALVIGGPDGLTPEFRREADALWQLSRLTLPHALVRVIVAEALYRAWSIVAHHPYHRS
jgi:23S rRNA (pseudouridine1915-N3)-methyltransferase